MLCTPTRRDALIDPKTALRRIVAAAALPFEQRGSALLEIAHGLDVEVRRIVGEALAEDRARIAEEVGHDWTVLDYEEAIAKARLPREWIEPGSRRRAVERIEEAIELGALRDDDTLSRLSLIAVAGDRLTSLSSRIRNAADHLEAHKEDVVWTGRPIAQQALAQAEADYQGAVRTALASPAYRAHLAEATIVRDRAAAEYKRLKTWLDRHDEESMQILGAPDNEPAPMATRTASEIDAQPKATGAAIEATLLPPPETDDV